jgi:hypothetical protein
LEIFEFSGKTPPLIENLNFPPHMNKLLGQDEIGELTPELQKMAGLDYQVPDLASVLKTLASFAAPSPQTQRLSPHPQPQNPSRAPAPASRGPEPPAAVPAPKLIDPATIIDWSSGLRCVMKTVAAHENIIKEIRRVSFFLSSFRTILNKVDDKRAA